MKKLLIFSFFILCVALLIDAVSGSQTFMGNMQQIVENHSGGVDAIIMEVWRATE